MVRRRLPNPILDSEMIEDAYGQRIVLRIQWDRVGTAQPVTLVAWTDPNELNEEPAP